MDRPSLDEQVALLMQGTFFADEVGGSESQLDAPATDERVPRGLREQMTKELRAKLEHAEQVGRPLRIYMGIDPTASSLHIGHMVPVLKLRQFQQLGHQVIFLLGDYTATIGDPSGQAKERKQLIHTEVLAFANHYTAQAFRVLDEDATEVRQNSEWLSKLQFSDIIELASYFPLKQIIGRRDFQQRLERGDSLRFHECLYSLMQGYDAHALECDVQVGAYDQHFNMLAGREIQSHRGQRPHVMLTVPLLIGTDGRKMSKSYGNTIMLEDKPADMYGKCMRISDDLLPQYLDLVTTMAPESKGEHKRTLTEGTVNPKDVKKAIAHHVVEQYFDAAAAGEAEATFRRLSELRAAPTDVPKAEIEVGADGLWLPKALAQLGMVKSSSEGRRMIKMGAVALDDERITDAETRLRPGRKVLVRVGKRRYLEVTTR